MVMYYLFEGVFVFFFCLYQLQSIIFTLALICSCQFGVWKRCPGPAALTMLLTRGLPAGVRLVPWFICVLARWAWNWPPGSQSPDSCSHRQTCHWKVIPWLGPDIQFVLPAVNPSLFSLGRKEFVLQLLLFPGLANDPLQSHGITSIISLLLNFKKLFYFLV